MCHAHKYWQSLVKMESSDNVVKKRQFCYRIKNCSINLPMILNEHFIGTRKDNH